jgi:protein-disulfide isomerase
VVASIGFLFVLYLVYVQAAVLGAFCTLCLVSAVTVATIFVLHLVERVKGPGPAVAASVALRPYAIAAVALLVLAGADVVLFDRDEAPAPVAAGGDEGSVQAALAAGGVSATCRYDVEAPRLASFDRLITMDTPYEGSPDAPVRMLKIFDPNCPHCKQAHEILEGQVVPEVGDDARLFYHPHALWPHSIPQIQALYLANEEGKFFEMLEQQFQQQQAIAALRRQGREDDILNGLVRMAEQIGMDGPAFRSELEARKYVGLIEENRRLVSESGVRSVPRLVIEGRVMASTNEAWTLDCIGQLADIAAEEKGVELGSEGAAVAPPPADS